MSIDLALTQIVEVLIVSEEDKENFGCKKSSQSRTEFRQKMIGRKLFREITVEVPHKRISGTRISEDVSMLTATG